jgi:GNAT superfamily N-acetyltransferase
VADAPAIAELWRRSVAAAFPALLPEGFEPPYEGAEQNLATGIETGPGHIVVGLVDGEPRGYCGFGPNRDDDVDPDVGEIRALFVHPAAWRRGLGRLLVGHALERLPGDGYAEVTLWSFATNDQANAFYEDLGFRRDGRERTQEEWAHIPQVRYRRALS